MGQCSGCQQDDSGKRSHHGPPPDTCGTPFLQNSTVARLLVRRSFRSCKRSNTARQGVTRPYRDDCLRAVNREGSSPPLDTASRPCESPPTAFQTAPIPAQAVRDQEDRKGPLDRPARVWQSRVTSESARIASVTQEHSESQGWPARAWQVTGRCDSVTAQQLNITRPRRLGPLPSGFGCHSGRVGPFCGSVTEQSAVPPSS